MKIVGKAIPHESARGHVTGAALYTDDLEALAGGWTEGAVARVRDILAATLRPIGDHRGSAAYRLAMAQSLLEEFRWQMHQEAAA
jgi:xanthine dehydrogenase iron-sulfur cluster and FAD-binding subunit A